MLSFASQITRSFYNDDPKMLEMATQSEWDIAAILLELGLRYEYEGSLKKVNGVSAIETATERELTFCSSVGQKAISAISTTNAGVVFCRASLHGSILPKPGKCLIFCDNPRLFFVMVANKILTAKERKPEGISPHAVISKTASIGSNCYIGPFAVIGDHCTIGNNTIIYDKVSIVQDCQIGRNCIVRSGAVVGSDGFAFERLENGELIRFPHKRGVILGNNVEICANTSVCRGSLSDTVIADGTKIDALVHVGHNAQIGKNCILTAASIIGGSARVGDSSWIGLNSIIKQKVRIGNNVVVAAQACVVDDVSDRDVVAGVPARSIKDKVTTDLMFMMAGQRRDVTLSSLSVSSIPAGLRAPSKRMQTAAFLRNLYSAAI